MKKIKLGFVGAGGAAYFYLLCLRRVFGVEVEFAGVAALPKDAEKFGKEYDIPVYDCIEDMIPHIDLLDKSAGSSPGVAAAACSSDAWLYSSQLHIPTVQFGPGSLKVCHSKDEHIDTVDIQRAAEILTFFIIDYCGINNESIG